MQNPFQQISLPHTRRRAFTLIELLVVIAVIGVLMTLIGFSVNAAMQKGKMARAQAELRELVNAAKLYHINNKQWPSGWEGVTKKAVSQQMLLPLTTPPDEEGNYSAGESDGFVYLELSESAFGEINPSSLDPEVVASGGVLYYVDPWGNPYTVTVRNPDSSHDGTDTFRSTVFLPMRNRRIPTP